MAVNPLARDVNSPPSGGRGDQRDAAIVGLEMRASPGEVPEEQPAEETLEEPGYGHGV